MMIRLFRSGFRSGRQLWQRSALMRWLVIVAAVSTVVSFGAVSVWRVQAAANSPYDDAATAQLRSNPQTGRGYDDLRKVKDDANHPCRGNFEVTDAKYQDGQPICTHGPDSADDIASASGLGSTGQYNYNPQPSLHDYQCNGTGSDGRRVQIVYAWTASIGNNFGEARNLIWELAGRINGTLAAAGAPDLHVRFVQGGGPNPCWPNVASLEIKNASDMLDFGKMVTDLQAAGFNRNDRKYLVYIDQPLQSGFPYSGQGTAYQDSSPALTNQSNNKVGYALLYMRIYWDFAETHELFHTLGAVQLDSPHTSGGFHCLDGYDLMCYADNATTNGVGVNGKPYTSTICPTYINQFVPDCNHDDYYSSSPPPAGSYLATHWNLASSGWLMQGTGQ